MELEFQQFPPKNMNLSDIVLAYSNGKKTKIIDIGILYENPIVYDNYYSDIYKGNNGKLQPISVTFCPYTSTGIIYFGKYTLGKSLHNGNITLEKDNTVISQLSGITVSEEDIFETELRREEVKIITFRNAIAMYPDSAYSCKSDNQDFKKFPIIYGINYISSIDLNNKYSAIVASNNHYHYKDSGYFEYFEKMIDKIREKSGIIIPTTLDTWKKFYPKTKLVSL